MIMVGLARSPNLFSNDKLMQKLLRQASSCDSFFRNLKQKSDVGRKGPWPFYRNLNIVFLEIFSSSGQQIFKSVEV